MRETGHERYLTVDFCIASTFGEFTARFEDQAMLPKDCRRGISSWFARK